MHIYQTLHHCIVMVIVGNVCPLEYGSVIVLVHRWTHMSIALVILS